jgi:hypothetical protein
MSRFGTLCLAFCTRYIKILLKIRDIYGAPVFATDERGWTQIIQGKCKTPNAATRSPGEAGELTRRIAGI